MMAIFAQITVAETELHHWFSRKKLSPKTL
jgi:hypothetical protein